MARIILQSLTVAALLFGATLAAAEEGVVYGRQLMTEQEMQQHREAMRQLKTEQERADYRKLHHEKMQARAQEMGVTLPDEPQQRGKGMGMGAGDGSGSGQGMGQGMGRGMGQGRNP